MCICMYGCVDGWMDGWLEGRMGVYMFVSVVHIYMIMTYLCKLNHTYI